MAAISVVLSGCGNSAAEICPPLLSELQVRLVEQGIEPTSDKFRTQYASAMRTCLNEPTAFFTLLTWSGDGGRAVRIQN